MVVWTVSRPCVVLIERLKRGPWGPWPDPDPARFWWGMVRPCPRQWTTGCAARRFMAVARSGPG